MARAEGPNGAFSTEHMARDQVMELLQSYCADPASVRQATVDTAAAAVDVSSDSASAADATDSASASGR